MKKLMIPFVIVASLATGINSAVAADKANAAVKVGVIDVQEILKQAPQIKALEERLQKKFQERQKVLLELQAAWQKNGEKLERDAAVLSDTEKSELQTKMAKQQRDLSRLDQDLKQDYQLEQQKELAKFFPILKEKIDTLAEKQGFDLILQKEGVPYAKPEIDVTQSIIDALS